MWVLYFVCTFVFTKIRSYGDYPIFFGYQRPPPYIFCCSRSMGTYTRPGFTVSANVWPFCCFYNEWWWNCGPHAVTDFSCMCTVLAASPVNLVNVSLYSYLAKGMECRVFSFSWRSVLLKLIFVVCDVPTKSTKICTPPKLLFLR